MTARELIEALQEVDPNTEVRIATQPRWPFEHTIAGTETTDPNGGDYDPNDDPDYPDRDDYPEGKEGTDQYWSACFTRDREKQEERDASGPEPSVFYILEGRQIGYLPDGVGNSQGWR